MDNLLDIIAHDARIVTEEAGMITLGELLARLEAFPVDHLVVFDSIGGSPKRLNSYRGYYDHVAIVPSEDQITAGEFAVMVHEAIGASFTGYKGGKYKMSRQTPVWVSAEGECSGFGVVGVSHSPGFDLVVIQTTQVS